ncbi:MAG TPA: TolC family protein [Candidatus Methylomirabilis sp.]
MPRSNVRACLTMILLSALFTVFLVSESSAAATEEPLTLSDVLHIASAENPILLAWDARVKAGEGELLSAKAFPNPEIGGTFGRITRFEPRKNEGSVELSQLLENPSKRRFRRQAAEMDLKALAYERDGLKLNLIFEVRSAFYDLLLTKKNLEVAQDNLRSAQTLLTSAKTRVQVGEAPEFELIKAQVEVARASNEVQKALSKVSLAKVALNTLMGRPGYRPLDIVGELESEPQELHLESLIQKALERHPFIQQQRYRVQKQSHLLDQAKASRYPDLTVSGFYEREPDKEVAGLGVSFPLPIWYRQQGAITSATAEKTRAEAELRNLQNETSRMVTEAYQGYRIAKDLVQVFTQQLLKQAEESRKIAEISYREGASGILDLIEAQRTARQTFLDYQQALYELKVADAALERVLGRGL